MEQFIAPDAWLIAWQAGKFLSHRFDPLEAARHLQRLVMSSVQPRAAATRAGRPPANQNALFLVRQLLESCLCKSVHTSGSRGGKE